MDEFMVGQLAIHGLNSAMIGQSLYPQRLRDLLIIQLVKLQSSSNPSSRLHFGGFDSAVVAFGCEA